MPYSIILIIITLTITGCGGGSSNSSNRGIIIEGQLEQGESSHHKLARHSEGEPIEEVNICALGECSTTDGQGNFGFRVNESFTGGEVLFSLDGHGINTKTVVNVPSGATEVFVHFVNNAGQVIVHHMNADGQMVDEQQHGHEDHEHSH